jgi:hypothetical protein
MEKDLIFLPVLVQVLLTLGLYIFLAKAKSTAMNLGQVNEDRRALYDDAWPENILQINNCIRNQFEVPVLFYALIFVIWAVDSVNVTIQILAWLFVLSRIVHAVIHTGSNYVPHRRKVFSFGCLLLIGLTFFAGSSIILAKV